MFSFSKPSIKSQLPAYGGGTKPYVKPSQEFMNKDLTLSAPGAGGSGMKEAMLMQMLSGMNNKEAPQQQMHGGGIDYAAPQGEMFQSQRDPVQLAYRQAVLQALMGGGR